MDQKMQLIGRLNLAEERQEYMNNKLKREINIFKQKCLLIMIDDFHKYIKQLKKQLIHIKKN